MKKIQISHFKKKHGRDAFEQVHRAVSKSCFDGTLGSNSSINITKIISNLPDNEIKTKFVNWSYGYDFAVFDVG